MSALNAEKHIGQYRILRTLGAGGMGTVFLGEHLLLGRRAAIKTLLPMLSSHREIVDRFFNEARAISAIVDPGVVQVFDFGYHVDGTAYIVMEYLEGESLSARLDRLGKLIPFDALRIARQLAGSLAAAHDAGIIHRDLKPGNVFLVRDGEAQGGERTKILDFGICKLVDDDAGTTQTGTMLGTPVYMSPEQCRGSARVDGRSDIYSVGCVLFHMLTGRPPFDCDSVGDYIAAHLKDAAPDVSTLAPGLPPEIDHLLRRCLAKNPDERFANMRELQSAIEHALALVSDTGTQTFPVSPQRMMPLGTGFQSAFVDQQPSGPGSWFVDSLSPVAVTGNYIEEPRSALGRKLLFATALVFGVFIGLLGTNHVLENEALYEAASPTQFNVANVEEPSLPVGTGVHEVAPPEPLASDDESDDESIDKLLETFDEPVIEEAKPPRAKQARPYKPVRARRTQRTQSTQSDNEDLYDTR